MRRGFTLIEILIYIGIFSIIIGGMLLVAYNIISGSSRLQSKVAINEEAAFILRKFDWALTGASGITVASPEVLEITNPNLPSGENPFVFSFDSGNIFLARGSGTSMQLNSASVGVTSSTFAEIPAVGSKPKAVRVQFSLSNLSQNQTFDTTKYLRK